MPLVVAIVEVSGGHCLSNAFCGNVSREVKDVQTTRVGEGFVGSIGRLLYGKFGFRTRYSSSISRACSLLL